MDSKRLKSARASVLTFPTHLSEVSGFTDEARRAKGVSPGSAHSMNRSLLTAAPAQQYQSAMPRQMPVEFPDAIHHVTCRGDRREAPAHFHPLAFPGFNTSCNA
jgi:hypothetical protein